CASSIHVMRAPRPWLRRDGLWPPATSAWLRSPPGPGSATRSPGSSTPGHGACRCCSSPGAPHQPPGQGRGDGHRPDGHRPGGGAFWSGAGEEIAAFAQQAQIPVITASAARGVVADSHPWCLGSLLHGGLAIPASDCVLVLGSAFNANLMYGSAPLFGAEQTLLQVDIAAERLGGNRTVDIPLVGDVRTVMHDLRTAWGEATPRDAWLQRARDLAA